MESISRPRQLFLYIAPFPALAFFKVWASFEPSPESLTLVTLALFMYCLSILAIARRWDKPTYFDWVIAAYFAAVSLSLLIRPAVAGPVLARYAVTGIYACLLTAAFFPPLLGRDPFTYHYARKTTPEELWENPFFIRINRIMTYAWSGIFAACLLFSLYPSVITRAVIPLGLILGFGLPFNLRFPDYYLKKMGLPSLAEQKRLAAEASATAPQDPVSMPLPESAWEAVSRMPDLFNPEAAGTLDAVIGFRASGAENFEAYLFIQKGACRLETRPPRQPDLLIRTPADVWLAVSRREMDGQQAFFQKAYQADGDISLLIRLNTLFSGRVSLPGAENQTLETGVIEPPLPPLSSVDQPIKERTRKEQTMKVLALNASPRGEGQSKTEFLLNHLVQGMQEAGAEVEVVPLRKKKIRNCVGCFTCWTKTPGVCIHQDDMTNELFPKWLAADLAVYAFPLYHYTVSAAMKTFIERTLPVALPFFEQGEAETYHPLRHDFPKAVVLSVAGLPEMSVFDQLSAYIRFLFGYRAKTLVAELYRPAAESLATPFFREKAHEIREAFVQAGREIVQHGLVTPETMALLTQDYIENKEMFTRMGNAFWKTCIAGGVTPKEFEEKGLVPRADSIETFMMLLPMGFNPQGAGDTKADIQFNFTGEAEGSCYFHIENGGIEPHAGSAEKPDLTIEAPFEVWMDIMTRKADGQQMFMEQKYKVNGDLSLLMRMNQFFGK